MTVRQAVERPVGVTVFGSATVRTEPDIAVVTLSVARVAMKPAESLAEVRGAIKSVRAALKSNAIDDQHIEVSRVALESVYDGFNKDRKFLGYRATVGLKVSVVDIDAVEGVLVGAVDAGATNVHGVSYQTSRLREIREEARTSAVAAARRKAEVYCEAADVTLGHVVHTEDMNPDQGLAHRGGHDAAPMGAADDDSGAFRSGSLAVNAAVSLTFALIPPA